MSESSESSELPPYKALLQQQTQDCPFEGILLALDPGETTGYAFFKNGALHSQGQLDTQDPEKAAFSINNILVAPKPDYVVYEDYRVYKWKAKDHTHSNLMTTQVIGCITTLCALKSIPTSKQMAQVAKQFCTDDKLKAWDFWIKGQRHARDAIRHGVYFLLFNWQKIQKEQKEQK